MPAIDPWWAIFWVWTFVLFLTLIKKWQQMQKQKILRQDQVQDFNILKQTFEHLCSQESIHQQDHWYYGKHHTYPIHLWIGLQNDGLILRTHMILDEAPQLFEFRLELRPPKTNHIDIQKPGYSIIDRNQDFNSYIFYQRHRDKKNLISKDKKKYITKIIHTPGDIKLKNIKFDQKSLIMNFKLYDINLYSIERLLDQIMQLPKDVNSHKPGIDFPESQSQVQEAKSHESDPD